MSVFIPFGVVVTYKHITEPDWYGWPAVTQCRICDKTIWEWHKYERRGYSVKMGGESSKYISVGASGIVHTKCEGVPEFRVEIN